MSRIAVYGTVGKQVENIMGITNDRRGDEGDDGINARKYVGAHASSCSATKVHFTIQSHRLALPEGGQV